MLSVIDFERGERAKDEQAHQWGTVFQTALPLLLVIPRLRPGLLSLRSVLSSRQNWLLLKRISTTAISINYIYALSTLMPISAIDDYHEPCQQDLAGSQYRAKRE